MSGHGLHSVRERWRRILPASGWRHNRAAALPIRPWPNQRRRVVSCHPVLGITEDRDDGDHDAIAQLVRSGAVNTWIFLVVEKARDTACSLSRR